MKKASEVEMRKTNNIMLHDINMWCFQKLLWLLDMVEIAHYINGPETLPAPLSHEEEEECLKG
jgi:hypothetical protein